MDRGLPPGSIVDLYLRVSTADQEEDGDSDRTQEEVGRRVCERYALEVGYVGNDAAMTSANLDRPALQTILARMRAGQTRGVVVQHVDRLTRNVGDAVRLRDEFFADPIDGCWLYNDSGPIDTHTPDGECFFLIMVLFSMNMRKKGKVRTKDTLDSKRGLNELISRPVFGKTVDPANPARSATGRPIGQVEDRVDLAALCLAQLLRLAGWSLMKIADMLTRSGFPTKRGGASWARSSVSKYLLDHPPPTDPAFFDEAMSRISIAGYSHLPILTDLRAKYRAPGEGENQ